MGADVSNGILNSILDIGSSFSVAGDTNDTFSVGPAFPGFNVTILGNNNTISLSSAGHFIDLMIDETVTIKDLNLQGKSGNNSYIIRADGGTFNMEGASSIFDNDNTTGSGGAVYVENGGTFNMNGGIITNNRAVEGGGVYLDDGGAFFKNGAASVTGNSVTLGGNADVGYAVGAIGPGGGIIFYVADGVPPRPSVINMSGGFSNAYYLEAAPWDWFGTFAWSTGATPPTGGGLGDGRNNTYNHLAGPSFPAAEACRTFSLNDKSDWFLPSSAELEELYNYEAANPGVLGFSGTDYWSSSTSLAVPGFVDYLNLSGPPLLNDAPTTAYRVRAIRAFDSYDD